MNTQMSAPVALMALRVASSYLQDVPKDHPYSQFMDDPKRRTVKDWEEKAGPGHLFTEKELRERAELRHGE